MKKHKTHNSNKKEDLIKITGKFISEQKYGEAINYLQKIIDQDINNTEALLLLEQIKKIVEYQNRDLFGSTNLDMDPWLE
ncbi:MAG: hypothetical protein JXB49_17010 [Bacteroidales bacterium]|nr:hypothetical protein [Bacteroidales bacterium]